MRKKIIDIKRRSKKKRKGLTLPLYFGYGLKLSLIKLSSKYLNLTSKIFKKRWKEAIVLVLLISIIGSSFFLFNPVSVRGATYTWVQTSWNTADTNPPFPLHPTNQTGWDKYYEKEQNIDTGTAGEIKLLSQDNHAYEKGGAVPTGPIDYASEATSADYTAISSSDNSRWVTALAANNEYDSQIFTFNIAEAGGSISNLSIDWEGYGETGAGLNTDLSIYNWNTTSWEQKDTKDFTSAVDDNLTSAISSSITNYVHSTTKQVAILVSTEKPRILGQICSLTSQCASGFCVDGVCCDSACSGEACQTCGVLSSNGIGYCGYVSSSSEDPDNDCSSGSTSSDGCRSDDCSGTDYSCGVQTSGDGGCPVCGTCSDNDIACEYHPSGTIDNGCSGCKSCSGSEIGSCTNSSTTSWGQGGVGCSGSNQRCYGNCITCGGWMNAGYCWYEGGSAQSCNTVCSSHGGVYQGTCNWTNDPTDCSTCKHWHSSASCTGDSSFGPKYSYTRCYYHSDGENNCESAFNLHFRQCACNRCPFFYSWNGSEYVFDNYIIHELNSKNKEIIQERTLNHLSLKGRIKAKITEEMNETAFIDQIYLKISKENKTIKLKPVYTSENLELVQKSDDNYLIMNYGDEIEIEFENVPEFFKNAKEVKVVAKGYYLKNQKSKNYFELQNNPFCHFERSSNGVRNPLNNVILNNNIEGIPRLLARNDKELDFVIQEKLNSNFNKHNSLYTDYVKIEVDSKTYAWGDISSSLISSPYNASDADNVLAKIEWTETLLSNTDIQFQVRTGTDSTTILSNPWCGPDNAGAGCDSLTYFTDKNGGETIDAMLKDGTDDQWIQYKVFLSSTGASTPTLSDVTMTYVVNAPPEFNPDYPETGNGGVSAVQNTDGTGTVAINYSIRDPDTTEGTANPGYITPSFEYSIDGGTSWTSITSIYLAANDLDNKAVEQENYTLHTATWSAESQIGSATYVANAQIRVTLNDNEAANYSAIQASASFTLDTIDPSAGTPTGGGTGININQNQLTSKGNDKTNSTSVTLNLSCIDDTTLYMILSNDGVFDTETYEDYAATKPWDLTSGNGTKTVYTKFKDAYGNEVGSYTDTITLDETSPAIPSSMFIEDVSQGEDYRLFVSWDKNTESDWIDYKLYRSTDGVSYSLYQTITDIDLNYYLDTGLSNAITYYYKATSTDDISNASSDSTIVSAQPGDPGDITDPVITNVQTGTPTAFSATITWDTDEPATSDVLYSKDPDTSCNLTQGVDGYSVSHSVTLVGLDAGSTYNFRVKSCDASDNCAELPAAPADPSQFNTAAGDTTGPVITNVLHNNVTYNSAIITWTTDEDSDSFVEYSTSYPVSSGQVIGKKETVQSHSVTLQNLNGSTTYYYKVYSEDIAGNETNSSLESYHFLTDDAPTGDIIPPTFSNVASSNILYNTATITWDTNENSDSYVEFGLSTSYGRIYGEDESVSSHSVNLPKDLTPDSVYHYRARSRDAAGNEGFSSDYTFETAVNPGDSDPPVITFNPAADIGEPTETSVVITWTTNEDSDSYIGYSTSPGTFTNEQGSPAMVQSHSVALDGLNPDTQYYFRIKSTDPSHNTGIDDNSGQGYTFATIPGHDPPQFLGDPTIQDLTHHSVTISWNTDINSDSFVEYGFDTSYGQTTGQYDSVVSHSVGLENLLSNTTYHYRLHSTAQTEGVSVDHTFTTAAAPDRDPPIISSVQATNIDLTSATITWTTDENSDSFVDYGTVSTVYNFIAGNPADLVISHSVDLANLSPGTTYYYRVRSKDSLGNIAESIEYTFDTLPDETSPGITNIAHPVIDRNSATITWDTGEPATSQVEYSLNSDLSDSSSTVIITDLRQEHSVIVSNLTSATLYYYRVKSKDASDNEAISPGTSPFREFTTSDTKEDMDSPVITNVDSSSAITMNSAVIIWDTSDEASNSIVDYGTTTSLGSMAGNLTESVTSHSVTLSGLSSGTLYYFQVRSQDSSGNLRTDDNSGVFYSFTTTADETAPTISNVQTAVISDTSAVITWDTNENATSQVIYGTSISYGSETTEDAILTLQHSVTISNLTKQTTYYYKVVSKDASDNSAEDDNSEAGYTFTTTDQPGIVETINVGGGGVIYIDKRDKISPVISNVEIKDITESSAKIKWETDEEADSLVEYGLTIDYNFLQGDNSSIAALTNSHSVSLTNLSSKTSYHFRALSRDSSGNLSQSENQTFTTLGIDEESSEQSASSADKSSEQEKQEQTLIQRTAEIIKGLSNPRSLSLVSEALEEAAKRMILPPLIAGESPKIEVGSDWAEISWITDKKSNSLVAYAIEEKYSPSKKEPYSITVGNPDEMIIEHKVKLANLKPSTIYHYQLRSKAKLGNSAKSEDKTFTTLSLVSEISDITLDEITDYSAALSWKTNISSSSLIEYTNGRTNETKTKEDPYFIRDHNIVLTELEPRATYSLKIIAKDEKGEEIISPIITFSTGEDIEAPEITRARTETALSPKGDKVQTIISWSTNEPSTTQVFYQKGVSSAGKLSSTLKDKTLTIKHIVVITNFEPGAVYKFYVESEDSSKNSAKSKDYTILTPQRRENIIQIIMKNFEQTFGWMKNIGI